MAVAVRTLSFREAVNEGLSQEMERDPSVILLGEDVAGGAAVPGFERDDAWGGVFGVTKGLVQKFGRERVLDTPISESAYIGAAVGAAATGMRPVAELMFVDFFGVCMDQIFNQGAKLRYMFGGKASVPMVIRTMIGAGFRAAGQHSGCHYSVFTHMPGLKCVVPSTPADAKGLLAAAIRDDDPVIFFEHKLLYDVQGEVPAGEHVVELGRADVKRAGDGVTAAASHSVQQRRRQVHRRELQRKQFRRRCDQERQHTQRHGQRREQRPRQLRHRRGAADRPDRRRSDQRPDAPVERLRRWVGPEGRRRDVARARAHDAQPCRPRCLRW